MPTFTESRLKFTFDDDWTIEQWDCHPAYRGPEGFERLSGTLACDLIGLHATGQFVLLEVKNFTGHHHSNRARLKPEEIAVEAARKVRDTLAGMLWIRGRSVDVPPMTLLAKAAIASLQDVRSNSRCLQVVLWLEDVPTLKASTADPIAQHLKRQLRQWFHVSKVVVTSLAMFNQTTVVPGLKVAPVP